MLFNLSNFEINKVCIVLVLKLVHTVATSYLKLFNSNFIGERSPISNVLCYNGFLRIYRKFKRTKMDKTQILTCKNKKIQQ